MGVGVSQQQLLIHANAIGGLSPDPIVKDREVEDLFLGRSLAVKPAHDVIHTTSLTVDDDGDLHFLFDTAERKMGIVVMLQSVQRLSWLQVQAISDAFMCSERGALCSKSHWADLGVRLRQKYGHVQSRMRDTDARRVLVVRPEIRDNPQRDGSISHLMFQFDGDGDLLISGSTTGAAPLRFALTVVPVKERGPHPGFLSLGMLECEALKDIVTLFEPGDALDQIRFMSIAFVLRNKYQKVNCVAQQDGSLVLQLRPTRWTNPDPPSEATRKAFAEDQVRGGSGPFSFLLATEESLRTSQKLGDVNTYYPGIQVEDLVASSGKARVFKGSMGNRDVALKIFKRVDARAYRSELRCLIKASGHPNLVEILQFFEHPRPCIVMNWVRGGSLYAYLGARLFEAIVHNDQCCNVVRHLPVKGACCQTCSGLLVCPVCSSTCHKGHTLVHQLGSGAVTMECLCGSGTTANKCAKQGSLGPLDVVPTQQALDIITGIAAGLHHLHSIGFVHRDMKSLNVLMDQDRPVIIDMGLGVAWKETGVTIQGSSSEEIDDGDDDDDNHNNFVVPATPAVSLWMPPEMALGSAYSDKTDVYALGIIIWEVLSARAPYCDFQEDRHQLPLHIMTYDLRPTEVLCGNRPAWLLELMKKCWSVEARNRPKMRQVLEELQSEGLKKFASAKEVFEKANPGSKGIDFRTFLNLLDLLKANTGSLSHTEIVELFEFIDCDHQGTLDLAEFEAWWDQVQLSGLDAALALARKVHSQEKVNNTSNKKDLSKVASGVFKEVHFDGAGVVIPTKGNSSSAGVAGNLAVPVASMSVDDVEKALRQRRVTEAAIRQFKENAVDGVALELLSQNDRTLDEFALPLGDKIKVAQFLVEVREAGGSDGGATATTAAAAAISQRKASTSSTEVMRGRSPSLAPPLDGGRAPTITAVTRVLCEREDGAVTTMSLNLQELWVGFRNGEIRTYDVSSQKETRRLTFEGPVTALCSQSPTFTYSGHVDGVFREHPPLVTTPVTVRTPSKSSGFLGFRKGTNKTKPSPASPSPPSQPQTAPSLSGEGGARGHKKDILCLLSLTPGLMLCGSASGYVMMFYEKDAPSSHVGERLSQACVAGCVVAGESVAWIASGKSLYSCCFAGGKLSLKMEVESTHERNLRLICCAEQGQIVWTCDMQNEIAIWSVADRRCLLRFKVETRAIHCMSRVPTEGGEQVWLGLDDEVQIHNVDGPLVAILKAPLDGEVTCLQCLSPDTVWVGMRHRHNKGSVYLWKL